MNTEIWLIIVSTCLTVIGYFMKIMHNDLRATILELGKSKGKIDLVDQEAKLNHKNLQQMTQLELKVLSEKIGDLVDVLREDKKR